MTAHGAIEDRCAEIGLPVIETDTQGRAVRCSWPHGGELGQKALSRIIAAAPFVEGLQRLAAQWGRDQRPESAEVVDGWTLLPIPIVKCRDRTGYLCAIFIGSDALDEDALRALSADPEIDAAQLAKLLGDVAVRSSASAQRIATLVRHAHNDLAELAVAEVAIEGFSSQLAESYEEITLLYNIGRAMKELVSAEAFVMHLCERMHDTLPYAWVAVRFLPTERASKQLSGRTFSQGESDYFARQGDALLSELAASVADLHKTETTVYSDNDAGPEVLCHIISRDDDIVGILAAGEKIGEDKSVSSVDMKLIDGSARLAEIAIANLALYEEQQSFFLGTLEALTSAIDAKDPYTSGHSQRVSELSVRLAKLAGLSPSQCETVRISGLVHDIGKIGVPESVLLKTSRLTDEEFGLIKLHPEIGHRILRGISLFDDALPGVLHHHERWDGRGYPAGLENNDIPLIARIIGVADAFDAMSSSRTYRAAMPREKVLQEIRTNAGAQFDPELVSLFLSMNLSFYDTMLNDLSPPRASEAA